MVVVGLWVLMDVGGCVCRCGPCAWGGGVPTCTPRPQPIHPPSHTYVEVSTGTTRVGGLGTAVRNDIALSRGRAVCVCKHMFVCFDVHTCVFSVYAMHHYNTHALEQTAPTTTQHTNLMF